MPSPEVTNKGRVNYKLTYSPDPFLMAHYGSTCANFGNDNIELLRFALVGNTFESTLLEYLP